MYSLIAHDGWQMLVDAERSSLSHISVSKFEPAKQEFVKRHLKKDHAFFDVGACEGFYSMLASKIVEDTGLVVAIEPDADNVDTIKTNERICGCGNTVVVEAALGREYKRAKLYKAPNVGQGSLIKGLPGRYDHYQEVTVTTLDDIAATFGMPDFIKIDVEGHEMDVLAGGEATLSHPQLKYIAMDVHPSLGVEVSVVQALLKAYGFNLVEVDGQHNELFAVRPTGQSRRKPARELREKL